MSKSRFRFKDHTLRDPEVRISGAALLVFAVSLVVAWRLLPPPLPKLVRLGTGPVDGHYARFGEVLRGEVAEHGFELELVNTAGSMDNIRLLQAGEIDVGLVQSGNLSDAEAASLLSVAAVFYEPVLVVQRSDWVGNHIEGGRIAIGAPGSGGHALSRELLGDQGVREGEPPGTRFVEIGDGPAVEALLAGEVDSGLFVTSIELPWVRTLFADPGLRVTNFGLAEAFTRHYRYLRRLLIPAGLIDLKSEVPSEDVQVIATTASLVIGPGTHKAMIPLLIESAREQLYQGSLLAAPAEFPSAHGVEAPLAEEALQYFERGPSFLYRWLPFRWAFAATRLAVLLVPLITLLYPLYHSATPAYRWVIQHRIYRWYKVLRKLEKRIDAAGDAETLRKLREDLESVGAEIRATLVPARYGSSLFALRAHHQQLMSRLEEAEERVRLSSR
jgi:TRAP-type uncharacterized transport system substrate-binding protein